MKLFVREQGSESGAAIGASIPLVLLHGLFGSADNLGMLARGLEDTRRIISLDLRNHGRSPHASAMSYPLMAADVLETLDGMGVDAAFFYGHSMGGKTAMQIALSAPERVAGLMLGDIAPVRYAAHHDKIIEGMMAVAFAAPQARDEAELMLSAYVTEPAVLSFLMTNWRRQAGGYGWRVNLEAIARQYEQIAAAPGGTPYGGPALFIKGGLSDYITAAYRDVILQLFPVAEVRIIEGGGHWFHAEKTAMTLRIIRRFLEAGIRPAG